MPIKDWKIAYSRDLGAFEVDPEVEKNTLAALDVFRSLGARVDEVDLGWGPWVPGSDRHLTLPRL